jgi:hypothetical protein
MMVLDLVLCIVWRSYADDAVSHSVEELCRRCCCLSLSIPFFFIALFLVKEMLLMTVNVCRLTPP